MLLGGRILLVCAAISPKMGTVRIQVVNYPPCAVSYPLAIIALHGLIQYSNLASVHITSLAVVATPTSHVSASLRPMRQS